MLGVFIQSAAASFKTLQPLFETVKSQILYFELGHSEYASLSRAAESKKNPLINIKNAAIPTEADGPTDWRTDGAGGREGVYVLCGVSAAQVVLKLDKRRRQLSKIPTRRYLVACCCERDSDSFSK